jgi:hypothetical protein
MLSSAFRLCRCVLSQPNVDCPDNLTELNRLFNITESLALKLIAYVNLFCNTKWNKWEYVNVKVKYVLLHVMQALMERRCIAPTHSWLTTKWGWVVSFWRWSSYAPGKDPWYPPEKTQSGPQIISVHRRYRNIFCSLPEIEHQSCSL